MKFKHRSAKLLVSLAASGGIIAITAAPASAGSGGTQGPGRCGYPPGAEISYWAQTPGANAGPNSPLAWYNAPGTPNAPGQAIQHICDPGG